MAKLKLSEPEAYRGFLERNREDLDVIIQSMKNQVIIHRQSECSPKRTRYIELCLEMAEGVRDGRL